MMASHQLEKKTLKSQQAHNTPMSLVQLTPGLPPPVSTLQPHWPAKCLLSQGFGHAVPSA